MYEKQRKLTKTECSERVQRVQLIELGIFPSKSYGERNIICSKD
jgi:hypothetical protein